MKFKLKIYPITENGEEIYHGSFLDVIELDMVKGTATTYEDYVSPMMGLHQMLLGRHKDVWHLRDDIDERDEPSELYYSEDGETWTLFELEEM